MVTIIVIITCIVSIWAFSKPEVVNKLSFRPVYVYHHKQIYRFLTHALVHADWVHLFVNMYVFYIFGRVCEEYFAIFFNHSSELHLLELYLISIVVSSAYSLFKHKDNPGYSAIGASGGVMAVVFTSIFFDPWNKLWFFGIVPVPGIVFGILYLIYSLYMGKKNMDNVGHDAHFTGAIVGFLFPVIVDPTLLSRFVEKLLGA